MKSNFLANIKSTSAYIRATAHIVSACRSVVLLFSSKKGKEKTTEDATRVKDGDENGS